MSFLSKLFGKPSSASPVMAATVNRTTIPAGQDPDPAILEMLRTAGLDLSIPYHVRYKFVATDQDSARPLVEELKSRGLDPEMAQEGSTWKVSIAEDILLDESSLKAKRGEFTSLAANFGAKYAGWELKTTRKTKTTFQIG